LADPAYLLDTNVVSELRKARPHGGVVAWLTQIPDTRLHVSAVSVGEIQAGIEITRGQDRGKAEQLESWLTRIASAWNVLPMDATTFRVWARLMHGRSDTLSMDAMIAATAGQHGLTVATRNTADFKPFGVAVFNPFSQR
jgi:predicted nucleic acid-binding protein